MTEHRKSFRALLSIHDVMPETLDQVREILDWLATYKVAPVTLLVVPGRDWRAGDLAWLRQQQQAGVILAGHGWRHGVDSRKTLYHKIHGLALSRMVAEHLSLDEEAIAILIVQCHAWFSEQELEPPALYVPPAWAMGRISRKRLDKLPFDYYESLSGIYRARRGGFARLPVTGYEADNRLRVPFLAGWNRLSEARARRSGIPARVTIHPYDLGLGLRGQLEAQISRVEAFVDCEALFPA